MQERPRLCALCGRPLNYSLKAGDPEAVECDHKLPVNKGGTDELDNLQLVHRCCNLSKSDKQGYAPRRTTRKFKPANNY